MKDVIATKKLALLNGAGVVTDCDVLEVLCNPVSQSTCRLAYVHWRTERTRDSIDDADRGTNEGFYDKKGTVMDSYEDGDTRDVGSGLSEIREHGKATGWEVEAEQKLWTMR